VGSTEAPQWLVAAWRRSVEAVGATADRETIERTGHELIERWRSEERVHHNLKRLIGVLARVDEVAAETHEPDVVRLAAWYHGAVFTSAAQHAYAHRGGADAEGSAALAREELGALGVPAAVIERVGQLIQCLSRHVAPPDDIDAQALCDADLGGLAAEPQRYEAYRREVRAEYGHIPERDYVEARLAIVSRLLARKTLFASPLGRTWENAARDNLRAELTRLRSELATLPERAEGEESHIEEFVAAKMSAFDEAGAADRVVEAEPEPVTTAADRVDVARRAARERATERRAAAAADRERRHLEKQERAERKAREREAARRRVSDDDDGSSMSRPPTR
jgi:predicted metal-dependent HD superfamily phosphohydrolase